MYLPGINYNELCTLLYSPGNLPANNWMICSCVGADGKDASCIADLIDGVRHGTAAETGGQTGHRRRVSETGTVIYIIGLQDRPSELLKEIIFFVCTSGRGDGSDLITFIMSKTTGHIFDSLVPGDLHKLAFSLYKGQRDWFAFFY